MLGTCAPRPVGWYAELRWKQKLEAAGFVVRETSWTHEVACVGARTIALPGGGEVVLRKDLPARTYP